MSWSPDRSEAPGPVSYTPEIPWDDGASCTGRFTVGARRLAEYVKREFPFVRYVSGYACRQNTGNLARTSVHGVGRAVDIMLHQGPDGEPDRRGDEIAQWLIDNADRIGVQVIIWDRTIWSTARNRTGAIRDYPGPNPHRDHIHVELNSEGASASTPWFLEEEDAPRSSIGGLVAGILITAGVGVGLYYGWKWFQRREMGSIDERLVRRDRLMP